MPDPIPFSDDLRTGVAGIDEQHAQLFAWANSLLLDDPLLTPENRLNLLRFLLAYTVAHFAAEERVMGEHHYPDLDAHRYFHSRFRTEVGELAGRAATEGLTLEILGILRRFMADWLTSHILVADKALAAFLLPRDIPLPDAEDLFEEGVELPDWMRTSLPSRG